MKVLHRELKENVNCIQLPIIQSNDLNLNHADVAIIIFALVPRTGERAKLTPQIDSFGHRTPTIVQKVILPYASDVQEGLLCGS